MKERIITIVIALALIGIALLVAVINYPSQAPGADLEKHFCDLKDRNVDACIEIYQPVCGWFDPERVQCAKEPCAQTYSNSCFACQSEDILYWTEGECPAL